MPNKRPAVPAAAEDVPAFLEAEEHFDNANHIRQSYRRTVDAANRELLLGGTAIFGIVLVEALLVDVSGIDRWIAAGGFALLGVAAIVAILGLRRRVRSVVSEAEDAFEREVEEENTRHQRAIEELVGSP